MTGNKKGLIFIIIGILLIVARFIDSDSQWSSVDWIKLFLAVMILGYGIYVQVKNKK